MIDLVGWAATGVFVTSYFTKPRTLRALQMVASVLWMSYGVLIHRLPVIVANVLVFAAAACTSMRRSAAE